MVLILVKERRGLYNVMLHGAFSARLNLGLLIRSEPRSIKEIRHAVFNRG